MFRVNIYSKHFTKDMKTKRYQCSQCMDHIRTTLTSSSRASSPLSEAEPATAPLVLDDLCQSLGSGRGAGEGRGGGDSCY